MQSLDFEVEGPAEIVGVINGDINSEELTVGQTRRLFQGKAALIMRSSRTPGKVILRIKPEGDIKEATIATSTNPTDIN